MGCRPGNSTRPLAKHFERAYGIDAGREMIGLATGISEEAGEGETREGGREDCLGGGDGGGVGGGVEGQGEGGGFGDF